MTLQIRHGLKRGLKRSAPAIVPLLSTYINEAKLPPVPKSFGHDRLIQGDWQMLGNDSYGDCAWAGAAHETMLWAREAGKTVTFTTENVLSDYAAQTGFDPSKTDAQGNNVTDQGTDMIAAAEYRRTTGILDADGNRHNIAAYVEFEPGDYRQLFFACYLFGAVGTGILLPDSAEQQFTAKQVWTTDPKEHPSDGHYAPILGYEDGYLHFSTWGGVQPATLYFWERYAAQAVAYLSVEALANNKSSEGFDAAALLADLQALKA